MTLYLKYRPQTISELDLESVRDQLTKIVTSRGMPHAFLFSGPRGAGKTSAARLIAKIVNCENPQATDPCNNCVQCTAITRGTNLDVIEIDAASNRGVDDVRTLRETVKLAPAGAKKKVYIIDEAHMLTAEAANALLKTLEEPPSHVLFILATTTPEKLLDTMRSRCTSIAFHKGSEEEVIRALKRAIKGEKIKIESEAIKLIAKRVDGSFREAHKILEQLSFKGKEIQKEDVLELLFKNWVSPVVLLKLLSSRKTKAALEEIQNVVKNGVSMKVYTTEIVSLLRKTLFASFGVEEKTEISDLFDKNEIVTIIDLFSKAFVQIPSSVIAQLPLELVIVEWGMRVSESERVLPKKKVARVERTQLTGTESGVSGSEKKEKQGGKEQVGAGSGKTTLREPIVSQEELEGKWLEIMRYTKMKNHSLEALLRAAKPLDYDGKVLKIEVFYAFHKDRLEKEPYRTIIAQIVGQVLGTSGPLGVICQLAESKKKAADVVNVQSVQEDELTRLAEEIFSSEPESN